VLRLALVAMLFFVAAGLVIAELGPAFPYQGGPYVRARLAFGRYAGTLVALIYVAETPAWVGGLLAITVVAVVDELAGVFVVYGSWAGPVVAVVAAAFIWVLIANGLTWTIGASRTQVAAGRDGIGPAALAGVSARTGTPVAASLLGGAVATATTLAAFVVGGDDNARYFSVVLALSRCWPCCGQASPPPRPTPISRAASPATAPASC
jgi:amino acid transporter